MSLRVSPTGFSVSVVQNILEKQYKCKLYLVKCSNYNIQFNHSTSVIPITGLYNMFISTTLGNPSHQEGIQRLKPTQGHCSLRNSFASCLVIILQFGLSHVFTLPKLFWLTQGDIHTLIMNSERHLHLQVIHSAVDSCLSKIKATL